MNYLVFRLYGPMASWGEIAVGETRHTASYPSKSAIIGLLAAALGMKRNDERQQKFQQDYNVAVKVFSTGQLLRDYHTAQVPDSVGKFTYRTRRDELIVGKERLGTILSSREYRMDALVLVAISAFDHAQIALNTLQKHLLKPEYNLYLGRKSCPLSAPLDPQIIPTTSFYDALEAYQHKILLPAHKKSKGEISDRDKCWLGLTNEHHYYWEGKPEDFSSTLDLSRIQTRTRHDQPLSRERWQFSPRREHYYFSPGGE